MNPSGVVEFIPPVPGPGNQPDRIGHAALSKSADTKGGERTIGIAALFVLVCQLSGKPLVAGVITTEEQKAGILVGCPFIRQRVFYDTRVITDCSVPLSLAGVRLASGHPQPDIVRPLGDELFKYFGPLNNFSAPRWPV